MGCTMPEKGTLEGDSARVGVASLDWDGEDRPVTGVASGLLGRGRLWAGSRSRSRLSIPR